jgi:esterase/lipase superfamily enzyme
MDVDPNLAYRIIEGALIDILGRPGPFVQWLDLPVNQILSGGRAHEEFIQRVVELAGLPRAFNLDRNLRRLLTSSPARPFRDLVEYIDILLNEQQKPGSAAMAEEDSPMEVEEFMSYVVPMASEAQSESIVEWPEDPSEAIEAEFPASVPVEQLPGGDNLEDLLKAAQERLSREQVRQQEAIAMQEALSREQARRALSEALEQRRLASIEHQEPFGPSPSHTTHAQPSAPRSAPAEPPQPVASPAQPAPPSFPNIPTYPQLLNTGSYNPPPPSVQAKTDVATNATIVRVFYATDRFQIPTIIRGPKYDKHRSPFGKLHLGECEVSIPKTHKTGKLESPSILRFEFRPNPEKHIVLTNTTSLAQEKFFESVSFAVQRSETREAFVFIHGYNVSFEDAARRTGQMAFDLDFIGAPIFYSWPSNGRIASYIKDETNITWTAPHFEQFLSLLAQHGGARRIHIIAHSMGNRAVCESLKNLSLNPQSSIHFSHLILAAPDIDAETFAELAELLRRITDRITLYESARDKALQASKKIHGYSRAGEPLLIIPGLDTIDASLIDTDFLGHSYFSDSRPLLSDIYSILYKDELPAHRFGLKEMNDPAGKYYAFRP